MARVLHQNDVRIGRPKMNEQITIFVGPASLRLGAEVCEIMRTAPGAYECRRFPDGEIQIDIRESIRGRDVFLVQSTSPPVETHLMELVLFADACRRAGAGRLTGVIPYFGYARQDRRTHRRSLGARVAADLIGTAGFDRLMLVDAHTPSIEGFFGIPIDHLTAVPLLARAVAPSVHENSVVVAPDLGAAKLADRYARLLEMPVAIVHKTRFSGREVATRGLTGDVEGRQPVIVDDMISTGGTIEAAAKALAAAGALPVSAVVATHGLFVGDAGDRLAAVGVRRFLVTDSVAPPPELRLPVEVVSVAPLLARAIRHLHEDRSLADLVSHD